MEIFCQSYLFLCLISISSMSPLLLCQAHSKGDGEISTACLLVIQRTCLLSVSCHLLTAWSTHCCKMSSSNMRAMHGLIHLPIMVSRNMWVSLCLSGLKSERVVILFFNDSSAKILKSKRVVILFSNDSSAKIFAKNQNKGSYISLLPTATYIQNIFLPLFLHLRQTMSSTLLPR